MTGIYQIQSKTKPERIYIGSASNITKRFQKHLSDLRNNRHHSKKLQYHYNKYGKEDLSFSIITSCDLNKRQLLEYEQFFLDSQKPYFNNIIIANSVFCHSEETRKKMSESARKKPPVSEITREKQRKRMLGNKITVNRKHTEAEIENLRKLNSGINNKFYGKKHTNESRDKMRNASTGRKQSIETIQKRISKTRGRKRSEEFCLKRRGVKATEETKKRISESKMGEKNPRYGKPPWNKGLKKRGGFTNLNIVENIAVI